MGRRRRYSGSGIGALILILILIRILEGVFHFLKKIFFIIVEIFSNPLVQKIIIIYIICSVIITLISYIIVSIIKKKNEEKRQAELRRKQQEEFRRKEEEKRNAAIKAEKERKQAAILAEKERLRIEEENRLAVIKAERERKKAVEKERLRLEREYQYGYRDDMTGFEYEEYCADLFRCFNWKTEVTPKSGDYGGDVIAKKNGITIVAQCKKYTNQKVGFPAVKDVWAAKAYYNADLAIVITNNEYAETAKKGAKRTHVQLLRHPDLGDWLIKLFPEDEQLKVKKKSIKTIKDWIKYYNVKLLPYEDVFKMLRGNDYDLYKATFDLWKKTKTNSDEWIFSFINKLDDIFSFLDKKAFDVKELNDATEKVDKLLPPEKKAEIKEQENKDNKISLVEWTERYKEQLSPFAELFKITEGDDFDLYKESYSSWTELNDSNIETDEWVNMLIDSIKKSFKDLEEKYGPINEFTDEIISKIIEEEKNNNL